MGYVGSDALKILSTDEFPETHAPQMLMLMWINFTSDVQKQTMPLSVKWLNGLTAC